MYYYIDNGKNGNSIKVHLSNNEEYIKINIPIWSKGIQAFRTGKIDAVNYGKLNFVVVEKYNYNDFNVIKVFGTRSEAKNWVYKKKRAIYPKEYNFNIVIATRCYFEKETIKYIDKLENHNYTYRYDGGDYVILDHGSIVARVDNSIEAKKWIQETEEELRRNAE